MKRIVGHLTKPIEVFISYSHEDVDFKNELDAHLNLLEDSGHFKIWSDLKITPGEKWPSELGQVLQRAEIIVLLLSANYFESDVCRAEKKKAVERGDAHDATIIPVLFKTCAWRVTDLAPYQLLPKGAQPINNFVDRDEAYKQIVDGIYQAAVKILERKEEEAKSIGDAETVLDASERQLDMRRVVKGQAPDVRELIRWAKKLIAAARYAVAEQAIEDAIRETRRKYGENHLYYADCMAVNAKLRMRLGDREFAKRCLELAMGIRRKNLPKDHPKLADSFNQWGIWFKASTDCYELAERNFKEALLIRRKCFEEFSVPYAQSLHNLARLYYAQGVVGASGERFCSCGSDRTECP